MRPLTRTSCVTAVTAALLLGGCAGADRTSPSKGATSSGPQRPEEQLLDRQHVGQEWPLSVDSGTVSCQGDGQVVFRAEGTSYAVNRRALLRRPELQDIRAIRADRPEGKEDKLSLAPLVKAGLALCDEP